MMAGSLNAAPAGLAGLLSSLHARPLPDEPAAAPDLNAIRQLAWDDGFAAGEAAAANGLAPIRVQLAEAAAALDAACNVDVDTLRPLFVTLVRDVAAAVLLAEPNMAALEPLVAAALAAVRPGERPVFSAHPETLAELEAHLPDVEVVADATLARGSFVVTGPHFVIAEGLGDRLAAIAGGLA